MDDNLCAQFSDAYLTLGGMGERVLGFCHCYLPADQYPQGYAFDTENVRIYF